MDDWKLVLLTAGVTTIGTVLVNWIGHKMTVRRDTQEERDRYGTYLAVRVASLLDPFVMSCVDVVNDRGAYDQKGELEPETVPPTLDLPQDVDWKSIDLRLMDRILTLPNEIANAEKTISFVGEMQAGPPDYDEWFDERRYQWAKLGLMALDLARDLRHRYELRQRDYSRYDPRDVLEAAFRKEDEMRTSGAVSAKRLVAASKRKAKSANS